MFASKRTTESDDVIRMVIKYKNKQRRNSIDENGRISNIISVRFQSST